MRLLAAFVLGFLLGKRAMEMSGELASADTPLGKQLRERILQKRELGDLLRIESEIGDEINRRFREKEMSL